MAFLESTIFPDRISVWSKGGNEYHTQMAEIKSSGANKRNISRTGQLARFKITDDRILKKEAPAFLQVWDSAKGKGNAFRFRNPLNYSATASEGTLVQLTATTWQMYKTDSGGNTKKILKPYGTITIAGGGTYSTDLTTGIITKSAGADPTSWAGNFHLPVIFDRDKADFGYTDDGAFFCVGGVGLIEVNEI